MIRARVFGNYTSFSSDFFFLYGSRFGVGHFLFPFPILFLLELELFVWVIFGVFVSFCFWFSYRHDGWEGILVIGYLV